MGLCLYYSIPFPTALLYSRSKARSLWHEVNIQREKTMHAAPEKASTALVESFDFVGRLRKAKKGHFSKNYHIIQDEAINKKKHARSLAIS